MVKKQLAMEEAMTMTARPTLPGALLSSRPCRMLTRTLTRGPPVGPPPLPARRKASTTYTDTPTREASPPPPLPQPVRDASPERRRRAALNKKARDDWEKHILKADWEELEVSRYLSLFGKDVHEVRSTAPLDPHNFTHSAFPSKIEWTNFDHDEPKFNASGYYIACLTALLSYLSPNQMVDLQRGTKHLTDEAEEEEDEDEFQQEFRLATLRASGQRLYYSALPLWEALGSRLRKTWRWESKSGSLLCLIGYTFLWWRGLLIASLIFSVIMLVLGLKSRPPPPDTLRDVLARQRRREEEERRQAQAVVPTSMRASAAPAAKRSQYSLVVEASQNYGLTASTLAGALADGHERAKNFGLWRSPRATWRLLFWLSISFFASLALKPAHLIRVSGAVLGILFFFIAPIVEHKPHWLGMEWSNPFDWIFAGVPNDAQYSMEVLRSRAQLGKPLVGDPALLMRPESEWKSQEVVTSTEGEEGSEKIDWTRWADLVLRGKSMAIRGTEVLAGSRSVQLPRVPVGTIDASTSRSSALLSHLSRGVNMGITALENKSKSTAAQQPSLAKGRGDRAVTASAGASIDEADVDGTFWAVYDGCCGHVVITPHAVLFRSLFAKRPRGRRGLSVNASASNVDDEQPLLDARTGQLTVPESELASESAPPPKVKVLFQCKLDAVKGIKKLAPAGSRAGAMALGSSTWGLAAGEGLRLVLKGRRGEVDFYQVRGRDEAFNRLLALAPQQWQRVN
ncbi:hypothetical protein BDZ90DRAFT_180563 [Jaminaea rosea]|uniref:GRAM domain-containing protein n=1 Tax=Jaminaea rosea TaxID=1569628 RepID=A0A316UT32_9BASI|nr:hypothetical protein BDZ90DRAFT_180563 [Jaminaea rosea]PWN27491.1 hypothetical protein BDZ90DRAFT_180563 [Jaminaea rosea]